MSSSPLQAGTIDGDVRTSPVSICVHLTPSVRLTTEPLRERKYLLAYSLTQRSGRVRSWQAFTLESRLLRNTQGAHNPLA